MQALATSYTLEPLYLLKEGGMGVVWLAQRPTQAGCYRNVIVKCLSDQLSCDPAAKRQFELEARLHAQLNHPHIVQFCDFFLVNQTAYLVLEHVPGTTLEGLARELANQPLLRRAQLGVQILLEQLGALGEAHRLLIHRDISPSNILISRSGHSKLCDFGLAVEKPRTLSIQYEANGKYAYMSPEQASGYAIDRRSDLFSLAASVLEFITQKPLLSGPVDDILRSLRSGKYLANLKGYDLPAPVLDLFSRAMQPSVLERFQSADEFRHAAQNLRRELDLECGARQLIDTLTHHDKKAPTRGILRREADTNKGAAGLFVVALAFLLSLPALFAFWPFYLLNTLFKRSSSPS